MKIATYNVWDDESGRCVRKEQLIHEIFKTDADIIALQEVWPDFWDELIKSTDYAYYIFPNKGDKLAFLSKYPLENSFHLYDSVDFLNSVALNVTFKHKGFVFSITNVHLPWNSVLVREKQILAINEYTKQQKDIDYFLLLGDFNCSPTSSVHNFLLGEQTLLGYEVVPNPYYDLARVHASLNNYAVIPTLDFATNPRWKDNNTKFVPAILDRILFMDNASYGDYFIHDVRVFGTDISPETGFAPSDHYGVLAKLGFTE